MEGALWGAQLAIQNVPAEDIGEVVSKTVSTATDKIIGDLYQVALAITYAAIAFWIYKHYTVPWAGEIGWRPATLLETVRITTWILLLAVGYVLFAAWVVPQNYLRSAGDFSNVYGEPQTALGVVAIFVWLGVLAPLLEEWIFRGFILRSYARRRGVVYALYAQTLIFAIVHGEPLIAFHALLMGWILGRWVLAGGSLKSAFYAHTINNLLSISAVALKVPFLQDGGPLTGMLGLGVMLFVLVQVARHTRIEIQPIVEAGPVFSGGVVLSVAFGLLIAVASLAPS